MARLRGVGGKSVTRSQANGIMSELEIDSTAFMASLVSALQKLEVQTEAGLWVLAIRIQNNARVLAPVDTGRLRASIQAQKGDGEVTIVAGTNYAAFVEFGTIYMAAQPFMRPALAAAIGYLPGVMKGAVG